MSSVHFRPLIALLLVVLPLAVGCGAEARSGPQGASVAPAGATFFLAIDTSFDSTQWDEARALVDKFPDGDEAAQWLLDELGANGIDFDDDVRPALGPETDVVGVAGQSDRFVVLAKPDDPDKLRTLIGKADKPLVTRVVDGWTVISDDEADVHWFTQAQTSGRLASVEAFDDVMGELPADALLRLYVAPGALRGNPLAHLFPAAGAPAFGLSVAAAEGGLRVEGTAKGGTGEPLPFEAELPKEVPAGALLYLDFNDLEVSLSAFRDVLAEMAPDFDRDLARIEHEIGISLEEDIFPLFSGESALYVRPGLFIPEVTLITDVGDEQAAMATVGKLVKALGQYVPELGSETQVQIDGVTAIEVPFSPPLSLYYAAFDRHLVVTTSRDGIAALREQDDRLADDSDFKRALDEAGVPDETTGFGYVDLEAAMPYVLGFMGGGAPAQVRTNLEPLDDLVFYGMKDGRTVRFAAFLAVD
jgi:uncharacterized protein DUF3352